MSSPHFFKLSTIVISLTLILSMISCDSSHEDSAPYYPQPIETAVKLDMEDYKHKKARQEWFDLLHTSAPGVNWKEIEKANSEANLQYRTRLRNQVQSRGDEIEIAEGKVSGIWSERGSNNQAGSIFVTAFDAENDQIYTVSAGGIIFKSHISGDSWHPINDDIQFHLRFLVLDTQTKRLVGAIHNQPHYSDDEGLTWTPSTGFEGNLDGNIKRAIHLESTNEIFFSYQQSGGNYRLYYSGDGGLSFESIYNFTTSNRNNFYITQAPNSDHVFAIEQLGSNNSRILTWDRANKQMTNLNNEATQAFGAFGRANLVSLIDQETSALTLKLYDQDNFVQTSIDTGKTWLGSENPIPETPWDVAMHVSDHDPDHLQTGGVDSYRSYDGGNSWFRVNGWAEYYSNPRSKLHADMMYYASYTDSSGQDFLINCNHGGMYISYDNGLQYENISQEGLNVGQYYSVRSMPANPTIVFAGSQDQGLQRGIMNFGDDNSVDFDQIISGDYGHNTFTDNGASMWTVYPFGSVSFYRSPVGASWPSSTYTIESQDESVWIPRIIADPDPTKNLVYAAGGSAEGGAGSFIIKMEAMSDNSIEATNMPFDFSVSGGTIASLAIDHFDPSRWYVSTTNRNYYYSTDSGVTFTRVAINIPGSQFLYGNVIIPSKSQPSIVYMAGSGYSSPAIVKSEDGGITYSFMSSGLPATTVLDFAITDDDRYAFAATEAGPYIYIAEDNKWYEMAQTEAPKQTYWSVEIVPFTDIVRFGTYGRGVWDFEITSGPLVSSIQEIIDPDDVNLNLYPNPVNTTINISSENSNNFEEILIFDLEGRLMIEQDATISVSQIDVSQLSPGQYLLKIKGESGVITKQFIKQ